MKFPTGRLVATRAIVEKAAEDVGFSAFLVLSYNRHIHCDWGDLDAEDKKANDDAITLGNRILSVYKKDDTTIWIITEADRSVTTVLFPEDY